MWPCDWLFTKPLRNLPKCLVLAALSPCLCLLLQRCQRNMTSMWWPRCLLQRARKRKAKVWVVCRERRLLDKKVDFVNLVCWSASWHTPGLLRDLGTHGRGGGVSTLRFMGLVAGAVISSLLKHGWYPVELHSRPLTASVCNSHFWRMSFTSSVDYISWENKTQQQFEQQHTPPCCSSWVLFLVEAWLQPLKTQKGSEQCLGHLPVCLFRSLFIYPLGIGMGRCGKWRK